MGGIPRLRLFEKNVFQNTQICPHRLWIKISVVYWLMNMKTKEYIEPAKAELAEKLRDVQDRLRDVQDRVSDKARNVSYATNQFVRENPWKTIAIVALAACLSGWFLKAARD